MASAIKFACVAILCMALVSAPLAEGAITCGQVTSSLAACIAYLRGGPLTPGCCNGVRSLNSAAKTTPDRQAACNCLKSAAGSIPGINFGLAGGLPGKCRVSIPYKISPSTDCSKVK
ncbi:Plant lipid transfer protein/Par allergen [Corchorus capsularis]|uniref:Non-specific lipid-transfer protein n=1 Tax=Corchorus capsularis TaxID=210143 RepID=A0A1R3KLW1_COCAP|nr:Plant lipid transfer protein/Par allergen [Corchorus capsularis]